MPTEQLYDKLEQALQEAADRLAGRDEHVRRIVESAHILRDNSTAVPLCIAFRNAVTGYTHFWPGGQPFSPDWLRSTDTEQMAQAVLRAVREAISQGHLPTPDQMARRAISFEELESALRNRADLRATGQ